MIDVLWTAPVLSSLIHSPILNTLPQRKCDLLLEFESENGDCHNIVLSFVGIEAYKCTYMTSLNPDMINICYGKIVSFHSSAWLDELNKNYKKIIIYRIFLYFLMVDYAMNLYVLHLASTIISELKKCLKTKCATA